MTVSRPNSAGNGNVCLLRPLGSFTVFVAFGLMVVNCPPARCTNGLVLNSISASIR